MTQRTVLAITGTEPLQLKSVFVAVILDLAKAGPAYRRSHDVAERQRPIAGDDRCGDTVAETGGASSHVAELAVVTAPGLTVVGEASVRACKQFDAFLAPSAMRNPALARPRGATPL